MVVVKRICKGKGKAVDYGCSKKKYIYGHGLCQYCYSAWKSRQPKKTKVKKTIKQKPLLKKESHEITSLTMLYETVWLLREHKSFLTGQNLDRYINGPYALNMFAHVLAKGQNQFPFFKFYMKNIVLLTPEEHHLLDSGTKLQRMMYARDNECDWNKIYKLGKELHDLYEIRYGRSCKPYVYG